MQDDDEVERLILSRSRRLRAILDAAHQRIRAGEGIPRDEFWKRVAAESAELPAPGKSEPRIRAREPRKS